MGDMADYYSEDRFDADELDGGDHAIPAVRFSDGAIDWDRMELLCPDAAWSRDSAEVPPSAARRRGRPPALGPKRRNRVAIHLTDAEHTLLQAYAAARRVGLSTAARLALDECLERERCASRAADTASEGASRRVPQWDPATCASCGHFPCEC